MSLSVRPFRSDDLESAAGLLAACERERAADPIQRPFRLDDEVAARRALEATIGRLPPDGGVAQEAGRLQGFLLATRELPSPLSDDALELAPRSVVIDENSCARAEVVYDTLRAIYAEMAEEWVRAGLLDHYANVPRAAVEAVHAWRSLGFGLNMVRGMRATGPLDDPGASSVEIVHASAEDHAVVADLAVANFRYHASSPILQPYLPETEAALRARERTLFDELESPRFVAYADHQPAGIATFRSWDADRPGLLYRTIHLQHGFTVDTARGAGVATALLNHGLAWAREQGYERCTVNWVPANPLGARFWQRQGFAPVAYRLHRRIDARIYLGRTRDLA